MWKSTSGNARHSVGGSGIITCRYASIRQPFSTASLVFEARDWFGNLRPTARLGAGMKMYSFTANGASSNTAPTGDAGLGFRGGSGPIEVLGGIVFLPSSFDQARLPLRGLVPQDQQQNDQLFTVGTTIRP